MNDVLFEKVQSLLSSVSSDVTRMHEESMSNHEVYLDALDDLAANILGLQSIVAAMVKSYPVDSEVAKEWLRDNMNTNGEGTDKAEAVVNHILD